MKIQVDFVLGMLGSGKTTIINTMIKRAMENKKRVLVIQEEKGVEKIKNNVPVLDSVNKCDDYLKTATINNFPDKIIVECNAMKDVNKVMQNFKDKNKYKIGEIICTVDAKSFELYFMNMGNIFFNILYEADTIFLNNIVKIKKDRLRKIISEIQFINEVATIIKTNNSIELESKYNKYFHKKEDKFKSLSHSIIVVLLMILLGNLTYILYKIQLDISSFLSIINDVNMCFLGIIIEGVPFILLGALLSSIFQVCISNKFLIKLIPKNRILSSILASLSGILFPICDCGIIPLARGLVKKGIPLNFVVSFILSAPILNPVSIISTYYAFPNNREIVVYRIVLAIIIAVIVGNVIGRDNVEVLSKTSLNLCNCASCNAEDTQDISIMDKIKSVFKMTIDEFFLVFKYLILGGIIASTVSIAINRNIINSIPYNTVLTIVIMMIMAFLISICSTSDAFIISSFLGTVSSSGILAFLVFGPMIDIKNTIMFLGNFKKKFVLKLIFTTIIVSLLSFFILQEVIL